MDQDFHYYGTYYAARTSGFSQNEATLVAKASNFIDFLHEGDYGGYWKLVRNTTKPSSHAGYQVVDELTNPRYTFQAGLLSTGMAPEDGLWCSYHFTPGNFRDPLGTPTHKAVHGDAIASFLPGHEIRDVNSSISAKTHPLLNRPQSALSRELIMDTIACCTDDARLETILTRAKGGWELLENNKAQNIEAFKLILLGARAHVIADTWAHQDFSGISDKINTYWDVAGASVGRQAIEYQDIGSSWKKVVLSSTSHENLQAVPNGTSYLGHGWMGHFPDYSFAKFRYKPCWRKQSDAPFERDNPTQYVYAWTELCSLFSQALGRKFSMSGTGKQLAAAQAAISTPCEIAKKSLCPRQESSLAWRKEMGKIGIGEPSDNIDAEKEPDAGTVLAGRLEKTKGTSTSRYGTYYINASSDLYLFQIAVDYHFHFVRDYLQKHNIKEFEGSWSQKVGPLSPLITDLFAPKTRPRSNAVIGRPRR